MRRALACRWTAAPRAEALNLPTDRPIVLTLRRLVRRMGLEDLVDAMATVRRSVPDALLLIVGRGTLDAELRERIAAIGLQDHVRLLGALPDARLPLVYRAADLKCGAHVDAGGLWPDHGGVARRRYAGAGDAGGRAARGSARVVRSAGAASQRRRRAGGRRDRRAARHPAPARRRSDAANTRENGSTCRSSRRRWPRCTARR